MMASNAMDQGHETEQDYGFHAALSGVGADRSAELHGETTRDSLAIKQKARELGADLVGICPLDPKWLTKTCKVRDDTGIVAFPWVIVIGVAMNAEAFQTSPSPAIIDETHRGYQRMKEIAYALGNHLSHLGYNAFSAGNGQAMSIPLAINARMGTLGRNGMLITPEYGSCLRICKVFTDMPLNPEPKHKSVLAERCESCTVCSNTCPANAIVSGSESADGRWHVNAQRCGKYWAKTKHECAACISTCPATW